MNTGMRHAGQANLTLHPTEPPGFEGLGPFKGLGLGVQGLGVQGWGVRVLGLRV